jgi:hypothetical protein
MSFQVRAVAGVFALALGLGACRAKSDTEACLPAANAEPTMYEVTLELYDQTASFWWYCDGPPPESLLDGQYLTDLVWVDGECDPCDRERIAEAALRQVCGATHVHEFPSDANETPVRLLCGPVPWKGNVWDRKGCVYSVATDAGWICD